MDGVAEGFELRAAIMRAAAVAVVETQQTIHGDPGHHFRIYVVLWFAAGFPHAPVGLAPDPLDMGDQPGADCKGIRVMGKARSFAQANAIQHFPVQVELALPRGRIADAHRSGAVPSRQAVDLAFLNLPTAVDTIHDAHLVRRPGHGRSSQRSHACASSWNPASSRAVRVKAGVFGQQ